MRVVIGSDRAANALMDTGGDTYNFGSTSRAYVIALTGHFECRKCSVPEFGYVEPTLRTYIHSLSDYRKNTFPKLASDVQRRIAGEWGRCFEEWGYPV